jgi:transposase
MARKKEPFGRSRTSCAAGTRSQAAISRTLQGHDMARLTEAQRLQVIALKGGRLKNREVARQVGCSDKQVARVWKKYQEHGTIQDLPRSGRPKVYTPRDLRLLRHGILNDQFDTAVEARRDLLPHLEVATVRRLLHQIGARDYHKTKKPLLSADHKAARLQWCLDHRDWTAAQ